MSFALNFPLFCIVLSLLFSVISSVVSGTAARRMTLFLNAVVALCSAMLLCYTISTGQRYEYLMGHYPHPWGNELSMGILEGLVSMVFAFVMFLCVLGGKKQLERDLHYGKRRLYYVMCDLVQSALLALVYTNDIFTGYVFIEICTLSSCGLLMVRELGRTTLASIRYMIFSLIGSGLFLMGVVILYAITGHLLMPELKESLESLWQSGEYHIPLISAMSLITVGIAIKSGMFPFHFWMPDTYGYATASSSGILSGLVSKGYIFFLIKVINCVFGLDVFYGSGLQQVLYVCGAIGVIVGSVSAIRENNILRMIAYSSAAQIGYIYMGIGISPDLGMLAAIYHVLTHAVTKPLLFLSSAQLCDTAGGSGKFKDLQGAAYADPLAGLTMSFGAFSMIGVPLTMGFISKYLFADAAMHVSAKLIPTLVILAVSTILNTLYYARTVIRIYNRPLHGVQERLSPFALRSFTFAGIIFAAINLSLGVLANPLITLLRRGLELM